MVLVYCEFQPAPHRNKRPATLIFLDDPNDKFPMPICSVCAQVVRRTQPNAILLERDQYEKEKASKRKAAQKERAKAAAEAAGKSEGTGARATSPSASPGRSASSEAEPAKDEGVEKSADNPVEGSRTAESAP
jgi:hypothetical protein